MSSSSSWANGFLGEFFRYNLPAVDVVMFQGGGDDRQTNWNSDIDKFAGLNED